MKKIFNFFVLSLIAFVLFAHSTPMSAVTNTEFLFNQAKTAYDEYRSLKLRFESIPSEENTRNFYRWKIQFVDTLNQTKENQSIEDFIILFSHFINFMYRSDLESTEYKDCKINFIPPRQGIPSGLIVVTLIDIYDSADIRLIL